MAGYAVSWSGGKDSTLALDRARRMGVEVSYLFNIYEGSSDRVRFHGVDYRLIRKQAESLGIPLLQDHTHPDDYQTVFHRTLRTLKEQGIDGVVFGNIHLSDIRAWFEEQTAEYGFEHLEPLWGEEPEQLLNEFIERGYRTRIVSIDLSRSQPGWLGVTLDHDVVDTLRAAPDVDLCGERGEYHTFAYDGPLFRWPVPFTVGDECEMEGHRFLDLQPTNDRDRN